MINWNKQNQKLDWAEYRIGDVYFYLGKRPDIGTTNEFYNSIDAFVNVSARMVKHEKGKENYWFLWDEDGLPQFETIFSSVLTIKNLIDNGSKKIYIHCDLATHRAPTIFGFFLICFYEKDEIDQILKNHKLVDRENWSNPIEYANDYIKQMPVILDILKRSKEVLNKESQLEEISTILRDKKVWKSIVKYKSDRAIDALNMSFLNLQLLIKYFFINKYMRLYIFTHKKLKTKKGLWYIKHKF